MLKCYFNRNSSYKSEFDRIRYEIYDNLHKSLIITKHHRGNIMIEFNFTVNLFGVSFEFHHIVDIDKCLFQVKILLTFSKFILFQLGPVHKIVHEANEKVRRDAHDLEPGI